MYLIYACVIYIYINIYIYKYIYISIFSGIAGIGEKIPYNWLSCIYI